ncbi:cupin domain-containing protein [Aestuariivirga sp.]|uniref:cupin domain-containing protein n=1 Tax=Aestuariivirga sp. TaxID=2650926 RepID=UPI0037832DE3
MPIVSFLLSASDFTPFTYQAEAIPMAASSSWFGPLMISPCYIRMQPSIARPRPALKERLALMDVARRCAVASGHFWPPATASPFRPQGRDGGMVCLVEQWDDCYATPKVIHSTLKRGFIELTIDENVSLLKPGSFYFFNSSLPLSYRNIGTDTAKILWVNVTQE